MDSAVVGSVSDITCSPGLYLGTMESPPLSVVGSNSKMEEMSIPSGTGTRVYMIFSCGARRRPLRASLSASNYRKQKHLVKKIKNKTQ